MKDKQITIRFDEKEMKMIDEIKSYIKSGMNIDLETSYIIRAAITQYHSDLCTTISNLTK